MWSMTLPAIYWSLSKLTSLLNKYDALNQIISENLKKEEGTTNSHPWSELKGNYKLFYTYQFDFKILIQKDDSLNCKKK